MKKVNVEAVALWLKIGVIGVELKLKNTYDNLPESDVGVDYSFAEFEEDFDTIKELVYMVFEDRLGKPVPDVEIPVEPEPEPIVEPVTERRDLIGSWSMRQYTRIPGHAKSLTRLPMSFQTISDPILFVFETATDEEWEFRIPNGKKDFKITDNSGWVYLYYEKGSPVVFTPADMIAIKVKAYRIG